MSKPWSLGSSEAAVVLGWSPWGSPMEVWARAHGLIPRYDSEPTGAMRRGSGMELGVLSWFALETGFRWAPGPRLDQDPVRHPLKPWLHSRVDAYVWETPSETATSVADAKTSRHLDEVIETTAGPVRGWGPAMTDRVPRHLQAQMLVHLACHPAAERCWIPALGTVDDDLRVYVIQRNERVIGKVVDQLERWVERHVAGGEPPPADGREATSRVLDRALSAKVGVEVVATPEEAARVQAARAKRATLRDLEEEIERIAQEVRVKMGPATRLVDVQGRQLATWKTDKNGSRRFRWTKHEEEEDQ